MNHNPKRKRGNDLHQITRLQFELRKVYRQDQNLGPFISRYALASVLAAATGACAPSASPKTGLFDLCLLLRLGATGACAASASSETNDNPARSLAAVEPGHIQ